MSQLPPKFAEAIVDPQTMGATRPMYLWMTQVGTFGPSVLFANLPSRPGVGILRVISDSTVNTWGATVLGGGANQVLAWFNGTAWTVVGR